MSEHEELKSAGDLLDSALDRYLDKSLAIQNSCIKQELSATTPPGHPSHAESERQFVAALELKLQRIKTVVNQTRNFSTSLVPIHRLPQESLARIFLFLFESRPKSDWRSRPETVSRVCTRWRNLSLSLPSLWRRINLPFNRIISKSLITRGKIFASRAHPLPLDVCLFAPYEHPNVSNGESIKSLLHEIAPHIGSLDLDTTWKECDLILSSFLPKCKPGVLKTLSTCYGAPSGMFFAAPNPLPKYLRSGYSTLQIGDSTAEIGDFNRVLASLTTLRLNGFYPFWTSQVYHGLTELRLIRGGLRPGNAVISEDHLVGIFRASPGLRILELSLTIVQVLPETSLVSPILLEHLEVLNIAGIEPNELGTLLRWVTPGPKPLQLAIDLGLDRDVGITWLELPDNAVTSFFARSQVYRIHTEYGDYQVILKLLGLCPRLETLACSRIWGPQLHRPEQDGPSISHPTLESLLILRGSIDTTRLLNTISGSPSLQSILFWECHYYDGESSSPLCADNLKAIVGLRPNVGTIDRDPTRDWGLFAP